RACHDARLTRGHRLDRRDRKAFRGRTKDENVHRCEQVLYIVTMADEVKSAAQPQLVNHRLELQAQHGMRLTRGEEMSFRRALAYLRSGADENVIRFRRTHIGDRADQSC